MYGTAGAGSSWVLFELEGAWGPSAFLQSPGILDPELGRSIVRRYESAGMRIVAIRRPGRRSATARFRWFMATAAPGQEAMTGGEVDGPEGYLHLALDGTDGVGHLDPLVAVCAHGKHDQCCAIRGRQVAAAISTIFPTWTWECSHLGGDRFAATMVILPHGLCYGRVDSAPDPADIVQRYHNGRVADTWYRGRTSLPHAVQAAQHFAREYTGDDRIDALALQQICPVAGGIEVQLEHHPRPITVVVDETVSAPLLSTCSAHIARPVREFTLRSITMA